MDIMEEVVVQKVAELTPKDTDPTEWNGRPLADWVNINFPIGLPEAEILRVATTGEDEPVKGSLFDGLSPAQFAVARFVSESVRKAYDLKVSFEQPEWLEKVERYIILSAIDRLWQEHLYGMDSLRNSIGLRAYGQRDPLVEYKAEAFKVFEDLEVSIKTEICHNIFRSASSLVAFEKFLRNLPQRAIHTNTSAFGSAAPEPKDEAGQMVSEAAEAVERSKPVRTGPKVGRNDPCTCGSGKKFKQCCGAPHTEH
jgi:preprotein translocase subunit SecA